MQFWYRELLAQESGGNDFVEPATIDLGGKYSVLIESWLTQVTQRPRPLARPPEFVVCPLMRKIGAVRYL